MFRQFLAVISVITSLTFVVFSQTIFGQLDLSFAQKGILQTRDCTNTSLSDLVVLPDQSILISTVIKPQLLIQKFTQAGKPDLSFGKNGSLVVASWEGDSASLALQQDGTFLIIGSKLMTNMRFVLRANASGQVLAQSKILLSSFPPKDGFTPSGIYWIQNNTALVRYFTDTKIIVARYIIDDRVRLTLDQKFGQNGYATLDFAAPELNNLFTDLGTGVPQLFDIGSQDIAETGQFILTGTVKLVGSRNFIAYFGVDGKLNQSFGKKGLLMDKNPIKQNDRGLSGIQLLPNGVLVLIYSSNFTTESILIEKRGANGELLTRQETGVVAIGLERSILPSGDLLTLQNQELILYSGKIRKQKLPFPLLGTQSFVPNKDKLFISVCDKNLTVYKINL
jgi:hypothetical protein